MGVRPAVISPQLAATPSVLLGVRRLWNSRRPAVLVALAIAAATLWSFWPTLVSLSRAWLHDPAIFPRAARAGLFGGLALDAAGPLPGPRRPGPDARNRLAGLRLRLPAVLRVHVRRLARSACLMPCLLGADPGIRRLGGAALVGRPGAVPDLHDPDAVPDDDLARLPAAAIGDDRKHLCSPNPRPAGHRRGEYHSDPRFPAQHRQGVQRPEHAGDVHHVFHGRVPGRQEAVQRQVADPARARSRSPWR